MIRLEPSHKLLAVRDGVHAYPAKADKGMHLVDVPPNRLAPVLDLPHIAVRGEGKQMPFTAQRQPPQYPIEQGPALGIGVCGRTLRHVHEGRGYFNCCCRWFLCANRFPDK